MSELSAAESTDMDVKVDNSLRKRVRHRKKQLYENILKQMEFYFSDANLTKDRFLGDLVKSEPFVPIDVFLKFNKIRSMTQDTIDIAKAMKNSTHLELSEDRLKIRRKTTLLPYDADARTIYVESIPVTASREWLNKVFSDYGNVAYISLPKFKNSSKIKGFAFIEFSKPEEAQKCMNEFTKMGCKLPTSTPPEELSSIKMFSIDDTQDDDDLKQNNKDEYEPVKKKSRKKDKKQQKNTDLKLVETNYDKEEHETNDSKNTDIESKDESSQDESKSDVNKKKKSRKRTGKERNKAKNGLNSNEAPKGALWGLQILPKTEWKSLRNKYLNLQRKYMKEMKNQLQYNKHTYSGIPPPAVPSADAEPVAQEISEDKNMEPLEKISGVFVKEILLEPCIDVRLAKRTIRSNIHALHVDVKEGQTEVIIRFDSPKAAEEYAENSNTRRRVLRGSEEEEQWSRAESARLNRRPRGRCRILAKHQAQAATAALAPASPQPTHTHIRFDDE